MQESLSDIENRLRKEYQILSVDLHERGRRKWAALQAQRLGYGGKAIVHRATGLSYPTIRRGLLDISTSCENELHHMRKVGGGRKSLLEKYPDLEKDLESLVEDTTFGDPEKPLRWTSKSTRHLCEALKEKGYTGNGLVLDIYLKKFIRCAAHNNHERIFYAKCSFLTRF